MIVVPAGVKVHLALGHTDMRNYVERTIMWTPRRAEAARRDSLGAFTPHNWTVGRPSSASPRVGPGR